MTPLLRRRNALWRALRTLPPGTPEFERSLADLCALTGWDRARVLAGLGLPADPPLSPASPPSPHSPPSPGPVQP